MSPPMTLAQAKWSLRGRAVQPKHLALITVNE